MDSIVPFAGRVGEDVEDWEIIPNTLQTTITKSSQTDVVCVVFAPTLLQVYKSLHILGNCATSVKALVHKEIPLSIGEISVMLPPSSFAVLLDMQQDFSHMTLALSSVMAFPVYVPYMFFESITHGSDLRMWALLNSSQMVFPHLSEWHLLALLYQEAGLELPNSLTLVVRERVTHVFGITLMSFARWLAQKF
jgi:hypothetical protein